MQTIEANWIVLSVALLVALLVAWWIFRRGSKGTPRSYRPDVLDEGAAPAQRNQALIDAPPAAATTRTTTGTASGSGSPASLSVYSFTVLLFTPERGGAGGQVPLPRREMRRLTEWLSQARW